MRERRVLRLQWPLVILALLMLCCLGIWLVGPGVSPHVAGQPILLSQDAWGTGRYLDAADAWLRQATAQEEQLLRALGPLTGVDWPVPAGGWPDSIYEQARLAQAATTSLGDVQHAAQSYAVPVSLVPTHEQLLAYLDASVVFGAVVLDYLGGPDEAKLPQLVAYWQEAQARRAAAQNAVARQRELYGWLRLEQAQATVQPTGAIPTSILGAELTPVPTKANLSVFATHTPVQ
ncbi:MAG: hypothetical protein KKA73_06805 [Chloroflexi bacterium]|nr:hypothetical protein [Chloroflexota bacterium]